MDLATVDCAGMLARWVHTPNYTDASQKGVRVCVRMRVGGGLWTIHHELYICACTRVKVCLGALTCLHTSIYVLEHAFAGYLSVLNTYAEMDHWINAKNHKTHTYKHTRATLRCSCQIHHLNKQICTQTLWAFPTRHPESPITANKGG